MPDHEMDERDDLQEPWKEGAWGEGRALSLPCSSQNLSPRQVKALEALLTSSSVTEAARKCGLSRRTLSTYLSQPAFRMALREAADLKMEALYLRLVQVAGKAVEVLEALLDNPKARPLDKLRASVIILDRLARFYEDLVLADRVEELEVHVRRWKDFS